MTRSYYSRLTVIDRFYHKPLCNLKAVKSIRVSFTPNAIIEAGIYILSSYTTLPSRTGIGAGWGNNEQLWYPQAVGVQGKVKATQRNVGIVCEHLISPCLWALLQCSRNAEPQGCWEVHCRQDLQRWCWTQQCTAHSSLLASWDPLYPGKRKPKDITAKCWQWNKNKRNTV